MLIKHLYSGRRKSDFVILKDNLCYTGHSISQKFIEENIRRTVRIHLVLAENHLYGEQFRDYKDLTVSIFSPNPWKILGMEDTQFSFDDIAKSILNEVAINDKKPSLVFIDSLSYLLQFISLQTLCTFIKNLKEASEKEGSCGVQIVGILHSDILPDEGKECKFLTYLASSVLTFPQTSSGGLKLEHFQSSGKILCETYTAKLTSAKEVEFEMKKEEKPKPLPQEDSQEKLVNTTFKLKLEEVEKESRNQVVLPYVKTQPSPAKGRILYEPDVNDDWDDEDPDDDLEI